MNGRRSQLPNDAHASTLSGRLLASGDASVGAGLLTPQSRGVLQWSSPGEAMQCFLTVSAFGFGLEAVPEPPAIAQPAVYAQGWAPAQRGGIVSVGPDIFVPSYRTQCLEIEYGAGNAFANLVRVDLRSGYIALPPVSYVRVSYVDTGFVEGLSPVEAYSMRASVSLVSGEHPQADVPTFTMADLYDGSYPFPRQTKAVEVISPGRVTWPAGVITQHSNLVPPVVSPPWSPVRVPATYGNVFTWLKQPEFAGSGLLVFLLDL